LPKGLASALIRGGTVEKMGQWLIATEQPQAARDTGLWRRMDGLWDGGSKISFKASLSARAALLYANYVIVGENMISSTPPNTPSPIHTANWGTQHSFAVETLSFEFSAIGRN
jgi:hypothetical protein